MKRIVECLLEVGILEEDIHRILDMIEEEYEMVDEDLESTIKQEVKDPVHKWHLIKQARTNKRNERNQAIAADKDRNASEKVYLKKEGRGKDNIYRTSDDKFRLRLEELKRNREKHRQNFMKILQDGLEKTKKATEQINKNAGKLK